jgi:hypothetical protein
MGSSRPLLLVLLLAAGPFGGLAAQSLDAPPPMPAAATPVPPAAKPEPTKAAPARPADDKRDVIVEDEALADLPPARQTAPEARIDQRRQGNRIVELTVTPAGSTRSYTIVNRDGQRPLAADELSAGLSTPRFFRFDF